MPELVAHPLRSVGVDAPHAGHRVAEALLGEDLRDVIFGHPRLMAMPQAVRREAVPDREPAGERAVFGERPDAAAVRRGEGDAWLGGRPGGDGDAGPRGGVSDGDPGRLAGLGLVPAIARGAEHAAGVVAAPGGGRRRGRGTRSARCRHAARRRRTAARPGPQAGGPAARLGTAGGPRAGMVASPCCGRSHFRREPVEFAGNLGRRVLPDRGHLMLMRGRRLASAYWSTRARAQVRARAGMQAAAFWLTPASY